MDVCSGLSFWRAGAPPSARLTPLEDDVRCDVAVLGGGITGALVAYFLLREGVDAVLVDKRDPAHGSTAASTGLLQHEVDTHLVDLIKLAGEARAVHAYRRGAKAINELEATVHELGENCGFSRRDALYFAAHRFHRRRLHEEFECRRQHGFDVQFLEHGELAEMSSISSAGAIRTTDDGQVDPYRLTLALLRRAQQAGLRLYGDSEITDVRPTVDGVTLVSPKGNVHARRVVFAAGYESQKYLRQSLGSLHSTYATVSQPIADMQGWPEGMLLWETARPYFYARQTEDGRAMIGGGDTMFSTDHQRDGLLDRTVARLKRRFEKLFPALVFDPQFTWAGTFGESQDGLAYIGSPPDQPHAYFAVGYGGNGITFSMIAARLIVDLYLGRPNLDAEVFGFDR